jgi:hypothetical protein
MWALLGRWAFIGRRRHCSPWKEVCIKALSAIISFVRN